MSEATENLVELKQVEKLFVEKMDELKGAIEKAEGQAKDAGEASVETKSAVDGISEELNGIEKILKDIIKWTKRFWTNFQRILFLISHVTM